MLACASHGPSLATFDPDYPHKPGYTHKCLRILLLSASADPHGE
jgi:hypothetical protein